MKIKLFVKYISLLVLLFVADGCKEKKADTYVTKVTDLTGEEEQVLKLEYDRDGKIIKYGDTPVRYEGDQITIGQMDCLNTGNKLCNVTFQIGKGKARESRARCMLKVGEEVYEADKQTQSRSALRTVSCSPRRFWQAPPFCQWLQSLQLRPFSARISDFL